jgi:hypothetical protein
MPSWKHIRVADRVTLSIPRGAQHRRAPPTFQKAVEAFWAISSPVVVAAANRLSADYAVADETISTIRIRT